MDPQACLELIVDAHRRGANDELFEAMGNLAQWLRGGGFAPHSKPLIGQGTNGNNIGMIETNPLRFRIFADPSGGPRYRFVMYSLTSAKKLEDWTIEPSKENA
jgi:hypothetical protein